MMQQQLTAEDVFKPQESWHHSAYKDHKPLLSYINWNSIHKWIKERIIKL